MESQAQAEQMLQLTNEFRRESDRAAALLAAAYLDELLAELLSTAMLIESNKVKDSLFEGASSPLSTFSSRILISYCLHLITKNEQTDLNQIRKIRNVFAHQLLGLSFDSPEIARRCKELIGSKIDGQPELPRECFTKAAVRLMVDIIVRIKSRKPGPKVG